MRVRDRRIVYFVMLVDFICMLLSYVVATIMYNLLDSRNLAFFRTNFLSSSLIYTIAFLVVALFLSNKSAQIARRSNLEEVYNVIKSNLIFSIVLGAFIFIMGTANNFSRGVFVLTVLIDIFVGSIGRFILKSNLTRLFDNAKKSVLLITTTKYLMSSIEKVNVSGSMNYRINSIIVVDDNMSGQIIEGIKVVGDINDIVSYSQMNVVDEVLFFLDNGWWKKVENTIIELQDMGIRVSISVPAIIDLNYYKKTVGIIGNIPVVSCYISDVESETLVFKRILDIIGGFIGSVFAIIVIIIFGPIIKLTSKGPILFKQKRVGLNGRYFYIYKLRTMCNDAESKKQELMGENQMEGHMFKMDNDPRVTGIGKFLRATSLDEFPQFFNVLKGDMSLVGTRPPTVAEFKSYKPQHKRRLSMKPGITGMWQVSGRSNITNFEKVVELDLDYIDNCTVALDLKIIAKTFVVVLGKVGSK